MGNISILEFFSRQKPAPLERHPDGSPKISWEILDAYGKVVNFVQYQGAVAAYSRQLGLTLEKTVQLMVEARLKWLGWTDESAYLEAMMYFVFDPPTEKK